MSIPGPLSAIFFIDATRTPKLSPCGPVITVAADDVIVRGIWSARVQGNHVLDNTTSGINVDTNSDDNVIFHNNISGSTTDVADAGTGNCWKRNTFSTGSVPPCP